MKTNMLKVLRLALFLIGLFLIFIGERYLYTHKWHLGIRVLGTLLAVSAVAIAIRFAVTTARQGAKDESRCWWLMVTWQTLMIFGVLIYFLYAKVMGDLVAPETAVQKLLLGAWLLPITLGIFGGLGLEIAHRSSGVGIAAEPRRITLMGIGWLLIGLIASALVCVNYTAVKFDRIYDWSYLKTTKPSEASRKLIAGLDQDLEIAVFFSHDNDVRVQVGDYFESLTKGAAKAKVLYFDKDLSPTQAEKYQASQNGQVILSFGEKRVKRIDIGADFKKARNVLPKLDTMFQEALTFLTQKEKIVYMIQGHGEMDWTSGKDPLRSLRGLEMILKTQQIKLKALTPSGGGLKKIPDDAAMVVIASASSPILGEEIANIKEYVEAGGRLMVWFDDHSGQERIKNALDEGKDALVDYLKSIGLTFHGDLLTNENENIAATKTKIDRTFGYTSAFSAHESVSLLSRNEEQMQVVFFRSGYLELGPPVDKKWRGYETVKSLGSTFADINRNLEFDGTTEKRRPYPIVAALETISQPSTNPNEKPKKPRVIVFADGAMFSDALLRNVGNQVLLVDSLRWMVDSVSITSSASTEEDVQIRFTKSRDLYVFYGTILLVPVVFLIVGFVVIRKRKDVKVVKQNA